jgi:transposase
MKKCPGYDHKETPHLWRALDLGLVHADISAKLCRVECPKHGVLQEAVPWARPGSNFTRCFEDTVAWLAARTNRKTLAQLMAVTWGTVTRVIGRVCADLKQTTVFPPVRRIGVDEVSYRRGHRYLTVVVDHDTGRLVFAHEGKGADALGAYFESLTPAEREAIALVSMDAAPQWRVAVRKYCPNARICMDPFHVVKWATEALDELRREVWRTAKFNHDATTANAIKDLRYVLLKNPENLSDKQRTSLGVVEKTNQPLFRGYLLKEQLRQVFKLKGEEGFKLLQTWLVWARRCGLKPFIQVAASITKNLADVKDALMNGLSNARVEGLNTRMQLLTRTAFGFQSHSALIAMALLKLGHLCPILPKPISQPSVSPT